MSDGPIDFKIIAELAEVTGPEFAHELVNTFLDEAPAILTDLKAAASDDEPDKFRRAAHSLKSNAETFGAAKLATLARDLELAGLKDDQAANNAQIAALEAEFDRAATALKEI